MPVGMLKFRLFLIASLLLGICLGCARDKEKDSDETVITLKAEPGKTVFDLLLLEHEVDYSESGMGVFIKSIDGKKNSGGRYWIYHVNGERGNIACNKFIVSEGDIIEWRYE
jgi:hypothetical protein